jgi:hypothetical protein
MTARSMKFVALALLVIAGPLFAQGLLPKKLWDLTISVNVPGSTIMVDGAQIAGIATKVAGGSHTVKVQAPGYADFTGTVSVSANMTYTVRLVPILFPLTISVSTPGAQVIVDNIDVTGKIPNVTLGSHTILVTAPGYQDYNATIDVQAATTISVVLQPAGVLVTVKTDAPGAEVFINNLDKGAAPFSDYLVPGSYTLQVSADGYADYVATLAVDKAMTINVQLKALPPATISFVIPAGFRDTSLRQGDAVGQIKIWVDGKLANPKQEIEKIAIPAGKHKIRVTTGALSLTVPDFVAQSGVSYVIDFTITVQVKTTK